MDDVGVSIFDIFEGVVGLFWVKKGIGRVKEGDPLSTAKHIAHLLHKGRNPCFVVVAR